MPSYTDGQISNRRKKFCRRGSTNVLVSLIVVGSVLSAAVTSSTYQMRSMAPLLRMEPIGVVSGFPGHRQGIFILPVILVVRLFVYSMPMMLMMRLINGSVASAFIAPSTTSFGSRLHLKHQPFRHALIQPSNLNHLSWDMDYRSRFRNCHDRDRPSCLTYMTKSDVAEEEKKVLQDLQETVSPSASTITIRSLFTLPPLFFDEKKVADQTSYSSNSALTSSSVHRSNESVIVVDKLDTEIYSGDEDDSTTLFPSTSGILSFLLNPIAQALQSATNGWALTYANLFPETESTLLGRLFLATNIAYVLAGLGLWLGISLVSPDMAATTTTDTWPLSVGLELASVCSFAYHYQQLKNDQPSLVRLTLMVDYIAAAMTILIGGWYFVQDVLLMLNVVDVSMMPSSSLDEYTAWLQMAVASSLLSGACLSVSWTWERGWPYLLFHSLWHLTSAYTGYAVGMLHVAAMVVISSSDGSDGISTVMASIDMANYDILAIVTSLTTMAVSGYAGG